MKVGLRKLVGAEHHLHFEVQKKDTTDVVVSLLAVKFLLESANNVKNWRVVVKVMAFVYKVEITF